MLVACRESFLTLGKKHPNQAVVKPPKCKQPGGFLHQLYFECVIKRPFNRKYQNCVFFLWKGRWKLEAFTLCTLHPLVNNGWFFHVFWKRVPEIYWWTQQKAAVFLFLKDVSVNLSRFRTVKYCVCVFLIVCFNPFLDHCSIHEAMVKLYCTFFLIELGRSLLDKFEKE